MSGPVAELQLAANPTLRRPGTTPSPLALRDALLLAWLAIEGPTSRQRLAELLWPQAEPAAARNALRQRLFQLRRQAGAGLVLGQSTLALADGIQHDLDAADDVLAGCETGIGGAIDAWLTQQRRRRQDRLRLSLAELATMAEQAGDWDDALTHARELLTLDPVSEPAHRRLIRLHYLAGDPTAALLAFDHCERVLKDEAGARPGPETLALLATVEASAPMSPAGSGTAPGSMPVALLRPPRLVGRELEQSLLASALAARQAVLLRGEPGMGKTRLLADLVGLVDPSGSWPGRIVNIGARPGDALVPGALARRWLQALLAVSGVDPDAPTRAVLARLLPDLAAPASGLASELVAALEVVFGGALAAGLRAVVIDDLQFADAGSLALLQPLMGRGDVAWVIALRPAELDAAAQAFCDTITRRSDSQVVDLPPLAAEAVATLLAGLDVVAPRAGVDGLLARTGGNPLYMLETIKAALLQAAAPPAADDDGGWPLAPGVVRLIQQRLARLSAPALRLARCAAVAGQDLRAEMAAEVLGVGVLDLADAWTELEAAQVLRGDRFAHDLIADAVLASLPAPVTRPLHAQVASWLEAHGGEPARVAGHWLAAGEGQRALPALAAAAQQASRLWQHEAAAELYERAADLQHRAGQRREAFDTYLRAAESRSAFRVDGVVQRMAEQLDALADDDAQRAWAACVRLTWLAEQRAFAEARRLAEHGLTLARRAGAADAEVELLWSLTVLDWDRRDLAAAVRHAEAALARLVDVDPASQHIDLSDTRIKLLHALGVFQGTLGRYAQSDQHLEAAIEAASQRRGARTTLHIAATLAVNALEQGDLPRARRWAAEALVEDDREGVDQNLRANTLVAVAVVHASAGDPGTALALAERAVALCDRDLVRHDVLARWRLAVLQADLGRRDLALRSLRRLASRGDLHGPDLPRVQAALLGLGDALPQAEVLERIVALEDVPLRATLLCVAQPGCAPADVLPLLAMAAANARDQGARGLWLALQGRRAAALLAAGRHADAVDVARAAWSAMADGVVGIEGAGRVGMTVSAVLRDADPELARTAALRTSAWVHQAASTLPPLWRDSYLRRSVATALPSA